MLRIGMDSVRKYVASRPESGGSKRQSKKNFVVCYKCAKRAVLRMVLRTGDVCLAPSALADAARGRRLEASKLLQPYRWNPRKQGDDHITPAKMPRDRRKEI